MRETLLTRTDDNLGDGLFDSIAWAFEKIGLPDNPKVKAAVLYGNEDDPERIDFYKQASPKITNHTVMVWTRQENE